jgi:single-strand DNA-binding protein
MNNLNSVLIEGNMVCDPVFRATAKGTAVCTFRIASNRFYKNGDNLEKEVSYFDIETWSKLAENCRNSGGKGRGTRVVGRLKQNRWTDADGKNRSSVTVIAEHVEFRPEASKNSRETDLRTGTAEETENNFAACF